MRMPQFSTPFYLLRGPGAVRALIVPLVLNRAGIRETARALRTSYDMLLQMLRTTAACCYPKSLRS